MTVVLEGSELLSAIAEHFKHAEDIKIVTPFLTQPGVRLLLNLLPKRKPNSGKKISIITRFDDRSIGTGICEPDALKLLWDESMAKGYKFHSRKLPTIHAKMILITREKTRTRKDVLGSANVTYKGLAEYDSREACVLLDDNQSIAKNDTMWNKWYQKAESITKKQINAWRTQLPELEKKYNTPFKPTLRACLVTTHENSYTESLQWVLQKGNRKNGLSSNDLQHQLAADPETGAKPENLSEFLHYLGLVDFEDDRLFTTALGQQVLTEFTQMKFNLLETLLYARYPQLQVFLNALSTRTFRMYRQALNEIKTVHTRSKFISGKKLDYGALSPAKNWLKSMRRLEERKVRGKGNALEFRRMPL